MSASLSKHEHILARLHQRRVAPEAGGPPFSPGSTVGREGIEGFVAVPLVGLYPASLVPSGMRYALLSPVTLSPGRALGTI